MKSIASILSITIICTLLLCCGDDNSLEQKTEIEIPKNKFSDENIVKIYEFLDHRQGDSLLHYLNSENNTYKSEAAICFASLQDSTYLPALYHTLKDDNNLVQSNAAWSIGQTASNSSFPVLREALENVSTSTLAKENILEALGKCANIENVPFFENLVFDESISIGYAKAIYAIAYKKIINDKLITKVFEVLPQIKDDKSRMLLASSLKRGDKKKLANNFDEIKKLLETENNPETKIAFIGILGRIVNTKSSQYLQTLITSFSIDIPDYRVIAATLRAYSKQKQTRWRSFEKFLNHPNENIGMAAVSCLKNSKFNPKFNSKAHEFEDKLAPRVRAEVLAYSFKKSKNNKWSILTKEYLENDTNPTNKGFYLHALKHDKTQGEFLKGYMLTGNIAPINTAATETLVEMKENGTLNSKFDFNDVIHQGFNTQDEAILATLAIHLRNPEMKYKEHFSNSTLIDDALKTLTLPNQIETYNELIKTKEYLTDTKTNLASNEYNHPLDWEYIRTIPKNQKVQVNTNKGKFIIELDIENAPGSVSNFLQLAEKGYFNNKSFHRVVPNFVIQTGCPRGDGYGSVDYSIRSEFSLHDYKTGAVGMASAGKDTESCQWFVTHAPTPFLEGRYTIFGYIVEEIVTVHQIKQGNKIISVKIL